MKLKNLLGSGLIVLLSALALNAQAKTDKPNILVIWGDDIGWSNITIDRVMQQMQQMLQMKAQAGAMAKPAGPKPTQK